MSELKEPANTYDPFSEQGAAVGSMICLMRIYDVVLAILETSNPAEAQAIAELHAAGGIVNALPQLVLNSEQLSAITPGSDEA